VSSAPPWPPPLAPPWPPPPAPLWPPPGEPPCSDPARPAWVEVGEPPKSSDPPAPLRAVDPAAPAPGLGSEPVAPQAASPPSSVTSNQVGDQALTRREGRLRRCSFIGSLAQAFRKRAATTRRRHGTSRRGPLHVACPTWPSRNSQKRLKFAARRRWGVPDRMCQPEAPCNRLGLPSCSIEASGSQAVARTQNLGLACPPVLLSSCEILEPRRVARRRNDSFCDSSCGSAARDV
jgi:hypothetical protein